MDAASSTVPTLPAGLVAEHVMSQAGSVLGCEICELVMNFEVTDISPLENTALRPGGREELSARCPGHLTSAHFWEEMNILA